MHKAILLTTSLVVGLFLAGCSKPQPPVGKWEGGTQSGGVLIVARVEIAANGLVRVSAPDVTNVDETKPDAVRDALSELQADLLNGWPEVKPREFTFDGKTFHEPNRVAPAMVWDKPTNTMTLQVYIGRNPALPVSLRPVPEFHDSVFGAG
jgi:hypothetical protein